MTTEFSLGMFGRKQERDLRQTATEELLSCSLKFSYALVSLGLEIGLAHPAARALNALLMGQRSPESREN